MSTTLAALDFLRQNLFAVAVFADLVFANFVVIPIVAVVIVISSSAVVVIGVFIANSVSGVALFLQRAGMTPMDLKALCLLLEFYAYRGSNTRHKSLEPTDGRTDRSPVMELLFLISLNTSRPYERNCTSCTLLFAGGKARPDGPTNLRKDGRTDRLTVRPGDSPSDLVTIGQ